MKLELDTDDFLNEFFCTIEQNNRLKRFGYII